MATFSESVPGDEAALEELLSRPTPGVVEQLSKLDGDLVLLGTGGKVGPSLAMMARRALDEAGSRSRVIGVSRWSDAAARQRVEAQGIETISADLADPDVYAGLPDAGAMLFLVGHKFGSSGDSSRTWWMNSTVPALAANRYRGVPTVAYSTGNVYPLRPTSLGGASESDPTGPVGDYAQSCLAREQMFAHAGQAWGTPSVVYRLNYAVELRYGVIADIATKILAGEPVDVTMPAVNVVWQGDSNAWTLQSLGIADPSATILNATGPETIGTRRIATLLGELLETEVAITGDEADDALLNDASWCHSLFGYPSVPVHQVIHWVAAWLRSGGRQLGKATKFQQREGSF
ncbi:NAD-dependent epimerase/dehydratase family protein [Tessaracoccus terricola]